MEASRMKYLKCEIVVEQDGDGYHGSSEEFPGLHVPGDTMLECLHNVVDAIMAYVESLVKHGDEPVPPRERAE